MSERDPEFEAWAHNLPPKHWARRDITAARQGWDAHKAIIGDDRWISVEERLPPSHETFSDGECYHGVVIGWFPSFYRDNARDTTLWTHPDHPPRWMLNMGDGLGQAKEPPTHWRPKLAAP